MIFSGSALNQILRIFGYGAYFVDYQIVINRLVRDKHKSEVHGILFGAYVLGALVNAFFDVALKVFAVLLFAQVVQLRRQEVGALALKGFARPIPTVNVVGLRSPAPVS